MSLKNWEEQIEAVRARAESAQQETARARLEIEKNSELTAQGKSRKLEELKEHARFKMAALRSEEQQLADSKRSELERMVLGSVGTDPSSVISYRDAQDRADKIENADEAERVMSRAITSGDKTLAMAIAYAASDKGFSKAYKAYTAANPESAEAAADLETIKQYDREGGWQRAMIYAA